MTKFIGLTEFVSDGTVKPILINTAFIMHIQLGMRGKDVHIRMNDKSFYFVKESFEEIQKLISPEPELAASTVAKRKAYANNDYGVNKELVA